MLRPIYRLISQVSSTKTALIRFKRRWIAPAATLSLAAALPLVAACDEGDEVNFEPAFGGRVFEEPVDLVALDGGDFLLAEKPGLVSRIDGEGATLVEVLDLRGRVAQEHEEQGLLSIAPDPAFASNGRLWVYYIAPSPLRSVLSHFTVEGDGRASFESELVVLEVEQPFENHNGGTLRFGPDGMLYLGLGDGGDAWDPLGNGQNPATLHGSILRLDVRETTAGVPYAIPPDNPFAGRNGPDGYRPEVWAYGMRNPWRMAFDRTNGDLWVGDVGQFAQEEIDIVAAGRNYGWAQFEGTRCIKEACDPGASERPIATYDHDEGCSVTGGVVYRGTEMPSLEGRFIYGDLCSGKVWAVNREGNVRRLAQIDALIVSFATGPAGEVYLLQFGGPILRMAPRP